MKKITTIFSIRFLGAILGISFSFVLARVLGAYEVGIYFQALNIAIIGTIIGRMGLDNVVLKFTAIYSKNNEWDKVNGVYKQAIKICLFVSVIVTILLYFLSGIIAENFYKDAHAIIPIQWMVVSIIPFSLMTLHAEILKGLEKTSLSIIVQHVLIPFTCLVVLLFYGELSDINIAVVTYVVSVFLSLLLSFIFLKYSVKEDKITTMNSSKLLEMGLPLLLVASMGLFLSITDSMMLAFWLDSSTVGIYGILVKIVFLSSMLLFVVNSIVAPKIASAFSQKEYSLVFKILKQSIIYLSMVALLILFIFFFFNVQILSIFGSEFISGKNALLILAVGQFFVLATGPVEYMLVMTGNEKLYRNIVIFSAILNIILNIALIPKYHMIGASVATATSLIIKNVLTAVVAYSFFSKVKHVS
jgi:O-antigen/teichoic acid export membrane protein